MAIIYPDMYKKAGKQPYPVTAKSSFVNVPVRERVFSAAAGAFLLFKGIRTVKQHPVTAVSQLLAGTALLARGISGHSLLYDKLGTDGTKAEAINIKLTYVVNRPRNEVFGFWRRLENLPLFMKHLESVQETDAKYSVWKAKFSDNLPTLNWKAAIVKERPNEFLGWSSVEGSTIHNAGKVEFRDIAGGSGTELRIVFSYTIPAGGIGTGIGKLFTPLIEDTLREDLLNFKFYIEQQAIPEVGEEEL